MTNPWLEISAMKLLTQAEFQSMAKAAGLQETAANIVVLESGKSFYIGTYAVGWRVPAQLTPARPVRMDDK